MAFSKENQAETEQIAERDWRHPVQRQILRHCQKCWVEQTCLPVQSEWREDVFSGLVPQPGVTETQHLPC